MTRNASPAALRLQGRERHRGHSQTSRLGVAPKPPIHRPRPCAQWGRRCGRPQGGARLPGRQRLKQAPRSKKRKPLGWSRHPRQCPGRRRHSGGPFCGGGSSTSPFHPRLPRPTPDMECSLGNTALRTTMGDSKPRPHHGLLSGNQAAGECGQTSSSPRQCP